ncbi:MAG: hypothetical protein IKI04_01765 [Bacilli bacterium]|nr:hypothetical protein [Bacilli bacterium]
MDSKKMVRVFEGITLVVVVATLLLSLLYSHAFVPSFLLMLALFLFEVCYEVKDNKKNLMYVLFILGVLLIVGSLLYTFMRLR